MSETFWTVVVGCVQFALGAGCLYLVQCAVKMGRKSKQEYETDLIRELIRRHWSLVYDLGKWYVQERPEWTSDETDVLGSHARWQVAIMDAIAAKRRGKEGRL
jgi:hypothetical protein